MSDDIDAGRDEGGRQSVVEAAKLYQPIVPLPGPAAVVRPDPVRDDLPITAGPQPVPLPPSSPALVASPVPSSPAHPAWPAADRVLTPELLTRQVSPERASVPSIQDEAPSSAAAVLVHRARLMGPWPWAVLLALGVAGAGAAGALWVHHARQPAPVPHETAAVPPPSPEAPTAASPADTAGPRSGTAPQTASEPPPAALSPSPELAVTNAAPSLSAAPQADTAVAPVPTAAAPPAPAVSEPAPPASAPAQADERIVIYYRRASPAAATAAARLADQLRPRAAQMDLRAATAIPRLPTIRYFWPEDATAAQDLVTALGRPTADWRVQRVSPRRTRPPRGTLEVWLPAS